MSGVKILILEDDASMAEVYAKVLRDEGHYVTVCTRFEDARACLKRSHPDAILTDIRIGEYNGLQLAHLFRSHAPEGRIVVVSGYDDVVIRKEVRELNATFLVKPIKLAELRGSFAAITSQADPPSGRPVEIRNAPHRRTGHA